MRASCPQCKQPVAITHIIVANYRAYIMDRMARTAFICFATMRPRPSGQLAAKQSRIAGSLPGPATSCLLGLP
jgi:hypothetical protein